MQNHYLTKVAITHFLNNVSDGIGIVLIPIITLSYYDNPILVGIASSARMLPWLMLSILVGYHIDNGNKNRLITMSNLIRGSVYVILSFILFFDLNFYFFVLLLFLVGVCEVISDSTISVIIPNIVKNEKLEKANYIISQTETIGSQFLGPFFSSLIISYFSYLFAFFFSGLIYLVSAFIYPKIPEQKICKTTNLKLRNIWKPFQKNRNFIYLAVLGFIWNFVASADLVNALFYIKNEIKIDEAYYSLVVACSALGSLFFGSVYLKFFTNFSLQKQIFLSGSAYLLSLVVRSVFPNFFVFFIFFVFLGIGQVILNIASVTYRQRYTDSSSLAKVNSIIRTIVLAGLSIGPLFAGFASQFVSSLTLQLLLSVIFTTYLLVGSLLKS